MNGVCFTFVNRIALPHVIVIPGVCSSLDVCTSRRARVPDKAGLGFQMNTRLLRLCISGMNSVVDADSVIHRMRYNVRRVRLASIIHGHVRITHVIVSPMCTRMPLVRLLLFAFAALIMFPDTSFRATN